MQQYTVKSGDTLSRIASQYGVPLSQISGYRSGNPNLIYPGESLSVGSPALDLANTGTGIEFPAPTSTRASTTRASTPAATPITTPTPQRTTTQLSNEYDDLRRAMSEGREKWDDNRLAEAWNRSYKVTQTAQPSTPVFDYAGIIQKQEADRIAEQERQNKSQEALFTEYQTKVLGQPTLESEYGRLKTETGLAGEEKQIDIFKGRLGQLQSGLNELDQAIKERTAGQFVSEAQRARQAALEKGQVGTEMARLAESYKPVFEQYGRKAGELGTMLGLVREQQKKELTPLEMRISAFSDRYATEMTGFNDAKKAELEIVLTKLSRDQQLSNYELQKADQLAKEERDWIREKEKMALTSKYNIAEKKTTTGGGGDLNMGDYLRGAGFSAPGEPLKGVEIGRGKNGLFGLGGPSNVGPQKDWLAYAYGNRALLA